MQAIAVCEDQLPDLIILDIMMPGMTGLEFLKWLRGNYPNDYIPVLLLTALDDLDEIVKGLNAGADDYVVKPFSTAELRARAKALLRIKILTERLQHRSIELEKLNQELQAAQQTIVERERQLAAGQLAGTALHQLGQPVTTILLSCHILHTLFDKSSDEVRKEGRQAVSKVENECQRMREILQKLGNVDAKNTKGYIGDKIIIGLGEDDD
jgi:DNA-binding response OmpR family regulator